MWSRLRLALPHLFHLVLRPPIPLVRYSNLPYTNHLTADRRTPFLNIQTATTVGISAGSITRVRTLNSQWYLQPPFNSKPPGIASLIHPFTREMVNTLNCGYCNGRLRSMNDLKIHLSCTRDHPVLSCCGRFFRRENDLERHRASKLDHSYTDRKSVV